MTLKHPKATAASTDSLSVPPMFTRDSGEVPRHELPQGELPPDVAYQLIHDELMLDGNARLNVATFVSTWMEPQAEKLMAECLDKNMIDKDEYPQTAELEMRCVNILSHLWHAPDTTEATGCSTTSAAPTIRSSCAASASSPARSRSRCAAIPESPRPSSCSAKTPTLAKSRTTRRSAPASVPVAAARSAAVRGPSARCPARSRTAAT